MTEAVMEKVPQRDIDAENRAKDDLIKVLTEENAALAQLADYAQSRLAQALEDVRTKFQNYVLARNQSKERKG